MIGSTGRSAVPGKYQVSIFKRDVRVYYQPDRPDIFRAENEDKNDTRKSGELPPDYYEDDEPKKRGSVVEFSERSRKRLAFFAGNCDCNFRSMVTLTIQADIEFSARQFKRALNSYLQKYRRKEIRYLWFFEFTGRGVPHVHILSDNKTLAPPTQAVSILDSQQVSSHWASLVRRQMEPEEKTTEVCLHLDKMSRASARCERVLSKDGAARYATKYAMKMEQKTVPEGFQNVGRFWAASRSIQCRPVHVVFLSEMEMREAGFAFYEYTHDGYTTTGPCAVQYNRAEDSNDWV